MGVVVAATLFTVAYGLGAELTNYVSVYHLGMIDPKFGDARGNLDFGRGLLPLFVPIATASFLAGIWNYRSLLARRGATATLVGGLSGVLSSGAVLVAVAVESQLPDSLIGVMLPVNWLGLLGLPALCGWSLCTLVKNRDLIHRSAV